MKEPKSLRRQADAASSRAFNADRAWEVAAELEARASAARPPRPCDRMPEADDQDTTTQD